MKAFSILFLSVLVVFCWTTMGSTQNYTGVNNPTLGCATAGCHDGGSRPETPQWMTTAHAVAYDSIGTFVQNNSNCLQCHTTGWDTTMANMGADDFVTIDTTMSSFNITIEDSTNFLLRVNVQCESCHGPTEFSNNHPPEIPLAAETCGECHQGEHHPYIEEWELSAHATSHTHPVPSLQDRFRTDPQCSGCHTIQGFIEFVGTTPEDTTNIIPNVMEPPGDAAFPLVCASCHDPHNNINEGQLRLPKADLCIKCHNAENPVPGETVHHATSEMFAGVGAIEFEGFEFTTTESAHQLLEPSASERCVTCHVFTTPFDEGDPNDPSDDQPAATGHTFQPRIESCEQAGCHPNGLNVTTGRIFDHNRVQTVTDSLVVELEMRLANATSEDSATQTFDEALFNLQFVTSSRSSGVHNPNYTEEILVNTIAFIDQNGFPTSIEETDDSTIPDKFALSQNYPNPFNPVTKIRFDVPQSGHVKLQIYNSLGQVVRTLVDRDMTAKSYEVEFNGSDLPSGLYFYRLVADNFTSTKKMLLLK